jgi:hypothetical protein
MQILNVKNKKKGFPIPTFKGIPHINPTITIRVIEILFSGEQLLPIHFKKDAWRLS